MTGSEPTILGGHVEGYALSTSGQPVYWCSPYCEHTDPDPWLRALHRRDCDGFDRYADELLAMRREDDRRGLD